MIGEAGAGRRGEDQKPLGGLMMWDDQYAELTRPDALRPQLAGRTGTCASREPEVPSPRRSSTRLVAFPDAPSLIRQLDGRNGKDRREDERRDAGRPGGPHRPERLDVRTLCHDLRQPITAIMALSELVADEPGLTPATRRRLTLLVQEARLLAEFVEHFLSRRFVGEPIDLGVLARHVVELAGAGSRAAIDVDVQGLVVVSGDQTLLHRALLNVVDNACRAVGDGRVQVSVRAELSTAVLQVIDSGPPPGHAVPRGLGLGLDIATTVMLAHGGRVTSGRSEWGGMSVRLTLPLASAPDLPAVAT